MDIIKDKYYGMTVGCAVGDAMGSVADIIHQEGSSEEVTDCTGQWNEGCALMLQQIMAIVEGKSLTEMLRSNDDLTNISPKTTGLLLNVKVEGCTHNTDCLPPIAAIAMRYVRDYQTGHVAAYNNELAVDCQLCMDACKFYHAVLDLVLHGGTKKQILSPSSYTNLNLVPDIQELLPLDESIEIFDLEGTDQVVSALRMILFVFNATDNITQGLTLVVNNSRAPVRTGALFGQLSGGYYGLTDMKEDWLDRLKSKDVLTRATKFLLPKIERQQLNIINNNINDANKIKRSGNRTRSNDKRNDDVSGNIIG
jgi:ADP-ribosylglycohydrolase